MFTKFGWNADNMLFLTRDYPIEPITEVDKLYYYGNQVLLHEPSMFDDVLDRFGRNLLDRLFIALCILLHIEAVCHDIEFKSLTCTKDGDKYIVRLRYDDEDIEMELTKMVDHFRKNR